MKHGSKGIHQMDWDGYGRRRAGSLAEPNGGEGHGMVSRILWRRECLSCAGWCWNPPPNPQPPWCSIRSAPVPPTSASPPTTRGDSLHVCPIQISSARSRRPRRPDAQKRRDTIEPNRPSLSSWIGLDGLGPELAASKPCAGAQPSQSPALQLRTSAPKPRTDGDDIMGPTETAHRNCNADIGNSSHVVESKADSFLFLFTPRGG